MGKIYTISKRLSLRYYIVVFRLKTMVTAWHMNRFFKRSNYHKGISRNLQYRMVHALIEPSFKSVETSSNLCFKKSWELEVHSSVYFQHLPFNLDLASPYFQSIKAKIIKTLQTMSLDLPEIIFCFLCMHICCQKTSGSGDIHSSNGLMSALMLVLGTAVMLFQIKRNTVHIFI